VSETNVFEHAIVHIPSVTAENQTIHPKMKREFSEGVNLIEAIAHDSLPTMRNPVSPRYCRLVAADVISSTKTAFAPSPINPTPSDGRHIAGREKRHSLVGNSGRAL
jgi:hypothetical protein